MVGLLVRWRLLRWRWLLVSLLLAVFVALAYRDRYIVDDAFIHLRVVKQVEAGHGPVFNAGERVEASTSPAWTWLLVLLDVLLPFRLEWIAVFAGIVLTVAGLVLAIVGAAELTHSRQSKHALIPVGALVFCAIPAVWLNASTGLENGLVLAWLGACLFVLARWSSRGTRIRWGAAAVLGLGPLVRPELLLFSAAFLALVAAMEWRAIGPRKVFGVVAAGLALPVAYEIFRMGYYASLVPNSAIAKEASKAFWSSGWKYFHQTVDPYWLWVPFVLLLVTAFRPTVASFLREKNNRALATTGVFIAVALLNALFVIRVGGDIYHSRLLLAPLFAFLAPVMVVPWRRSYAGVALIGVWALITMVALRSGADTPRFLSSPRNPMTAEDYLGKHFVGISWFTGQGEYYLTRRLPARALPGKSPSVAAYGVGALGYVLGPKVYVLDLLGLGDAFTSHLQLGHQRGPLVAHEKPLPSPWIVARLIAPPDTLASGMFPVPEFMNIIPVAEQRLDPPTNEPFPQRVQDARKALRCGDINALIQATSGRLTIGRFLHNLAHAPKFTTLRIPAEPAAAVSRFCR